MPRNHPRNKRLRHKQNTFHMTTHRGFQVTVACHATPFQLSQPLAPPSLVLPLVGYLQHQQLIRCDRSWQVTSQAKIPPGGRVIFIIYIYTYISPNLFWRWTNSKVWLSMKHVELFFWRKLDSRQSKRSNWMFGKPIWSSISCRSFRT